MKIHLSSLSVKCLALAMVVAAGAAMTASAKKENKAVGVPKAHYEFPQKKTPVDLKRYSTTVYQYAGNEAYTCQGAFLGELGDEITEMEVNPSGVNYVLISNTKKAPVIQANHISETKRYAKFNTKKLGLPASVVYTPDARSLLYANDKGILYKLDTKEFEGTRHMKLPFVPKDMVMSGNGYFLALNGGNEVAVYAFEDSIQRLNMKYDSPVTKVGFNGDNTEFAVLTSEGILSIYDTRTYLLKKSLDDLGDGIDFDYNFDGKYVAVAIDPSTIEIVNLLDIDDRDRINVPSARISSILFVPDARDNTILFYNTDSKIAADRMTRLSPYYGRLIADEANERLNEWMKMMPGETMEQYRARVTDESRRKQYQLFEEEISTLLAADLLSMSTVTLGKYDRTNKVLEVDFDNMPSIFLPVDETDVTSFRDVSDLVFRNAKYGIMSDDRFELIYAEVYNRADGKTYTFNNLDRVPLNFMQGDDDNVVSLAIIQQQQMEEIKLQEIRQKVVEEAKKENIISDHTNITVDSRVEPSYDAAGNKILNYKVRFTYEVDPEYTIYEDFGPGKYHVSESGAASSMLRIVKEALEGDFSQYLVPGKKLNIKVSGTADALPVNRIIPYDGAYGDFEDEPVYLDDQLTAISVNRKGGITRNEQLAFLRAEGVINFIKENIANLQNMTTDTQTHIAVAEDTGSQFRRITAEFTFVDAL